MLFRSGHSKTFMNSVLCGTLGETCLLISTLSSSLWISLFLFMLQESRLAEMSLTLLLDLSFSLLSLNEVLGRGETCVTSLSLLNEELPERNICSPKTVLLELPVVDLCVCWPGYSLPGISTSGNLCTQELISFSFSCSIPILLGEHRLVAGSSFLLLKVGQSLV